ncbi:MAG: hypothetical protein J0M04_19895 [Verrucomicrobia bacterium]|nr:hypothetical protein [Verrucomicrobiota bacterium]
MNQGQKVSILKQPQLGYGDLASYNPSVAMAVIRFFTNPIRYLEIDSSPDAIEHAVLPSETRCFRRIDGITQYGRVLSCASQNGAREYLVKFGGHEEIERLREEDFHVRSYLPADDPAEVLAALANETPFFFAHRSALLRELLRQDRLCHGLRSLASSKIEMLPHQAEIASRVLRDPTIRYLLADEVGLGKTIEAGIILRQLWLDAPGIRIGVTVPDVLVRQWRTEITERFGLADVEIFPHTELAENGRTHKWDVLVIDEAHRVVASDLASDTALSRGARNAARQASHLLLLSATPAIHHDAELLALLELLDPDNYSREDLVAFQFRTAKRIELGRALLALRSATVPALVKRNAVALSNLLPNDATLRELAGCIAEPNAEIRSLQRALHLHISETYRLHRRMLRTRRRWLADAQERFVRNIKEIVEYELEEEPHARLWGILDEWRTEAAARVHRDTNLRSLCAADYVRLAEAIAAEPDRLEELALEVAERTNATESERHLLLRLGEEAPVEELIAARLELLAEILRRRLQHDGPSAKYLVFCPTPAICARLGKHLITHLPTRGIFIADSILDWGETGDVFAKFADDRKMHVLITDAVGEEGFNLQFARAVIFYDLPWSPMRLEQRLGRLDRIDCSGKISCIVLTTGEDDTIALDEAWRRVVSEGLGLFDASISDLQHLIDVEVPQLRDRAFIGGPFVLLEDIENLAAAVKIERAEIEEQDVIDGMHSLSPNSSLYRDLAEADRDAENLGKALTHYLKENVGLKQWWDENDNSFTFRLPRDMDPIIPADRLETLAQLCNAPFTVYRSVAIEDFSLQFLRPGHPCVEGCRELLAWDDRGRSFAMWRQMTGAKHLRVAFRCIVHVSVDLAIVRSALEEERWDAIRCGGLLRLARGWFPEFLAESFVDEHGALQTAAIVETCRKPYNQHDKSLGKDRARHIREAFGANTWHEMCLSAAESVLTAVREGEELARACAQAQFEASEHFALVHTRTGARQQAGIENTIQAVAALEEEKMIEKLVGKILANPVVRLDTIGAYFLSEQPFWSQAK